MDGIGLVTANVKDRIALRGVRLVARLTAMSQRTTVEQTFVNCERHAIEAVYTFPLPEAAAVCGFEVITADRVLTGKVEETEAAIEQYDDAVGQGHGAFLVEQDRPDVFTVRVGNLKPRQAATIRLTYVCPLEITDRSIRVAFPTTVAPRYATDAGSDDTLQSEMDADALNPPHVLSVPYGLAMQVDVDLGKAVRAVTSPSHAIQVEPRDAGVLRVTLAGGKTPMDRDVVLSLELNKEQDPAAVVAADKDGTSYLAVTFVPEFDTDELAEPAPAETVFVLDCSGSMMGESIAQATAALELCLRSLSPGDTFNVCKFGSTFELLASEPLVYSETTLRRAIQYVQQVRDLGGTELYAPLEAILATAPAAVRMRQIVLLTDGQVSNEPQVVELARKHRDRNRIFTFGIGAASSSFLVRGLARATRGAAEFIAAGERIEDKVLRTFGRMTSPPVTDVLVDWGDADVQTLAEIPPVFDGEALAVFGRCAGRAPGRVTLKCSTATGPKMWTLAVSRVRDDERAIATLWARRMIQSMEEVNSIRRTSVSARKQQRDHQTLISLSNEFGLICSLTTFIAVEHRSIEERNEGAPALRRVPVQLARGWGGMAGGVAASAAPMASPAAPMLYRTIDKTIDRTIDRLRDANSAEALGMSMDAAPRGRRPGGFLGRFRGVLAPAGRQANEAERVATPPKDAMQAILALQTADGWFDDDRRVDQAIAEFGSDPAAWRRAVRTALGHIVAPPSGDPSTLVRTVLALLLLRTRFGDRSPQWRRAAQKATHWCVGALGLPTTKEVEEVLNDLEKQLGPASKGT